MYKCINEHLPEIKFGVISYLFGYTTLSRLLCAFPKRFVNVFLNKLTFPADTYTIESYKDVRPWRVAYKLTFPGWKKIHVTCK